MEEETPRPEETPTEAPKERSILASWWFWVLVIIIIALILWWALATPTTTEEELLEVPTPAEETE